MRLEHLKTLTAAEYALEVDKQRKAGKALGYQRIVTYTLDTEPGTSLRAAGWECMGLAGGKRWTGTRRPAVDLYPAQMKLRYEKEL